MKKILKIITAIGVLFLFVWTLFYLYKKSEQKPVVYSTEMPFKTTIVKKSVATGSIMPRKEIEIKPQVSGIIDKLYVKAGDKVSKNQIIAKIKIIPDMVNLNNAQNRVERAKISFADAEIDYKRQESLFKDKVIAEAEFQKTTLAYRSAKEELNAAENNLQLIKEGAIASAGESSNTLIRSTVEGMVLNVPIKEGNLVIESSTFNNGTTIATVADMNEMIFEGKVDESEVGKIKEGMEILLSIAAIENQTFKATLEYISPKGIEENGAIQFEIKAALSIENEVFIRAGYSANADIVLDKRDDVLAIRESLLIFEKDSLFVEIEKAEQIFEKVAIKTGLSDGINIEILDGISETDKIKGKAL
jgi:HlyD family secretion protein